MPTDSQPETTIIGRLTQTNRFLRELSDNSQPHISRNLDKIIVFLDGVISHIVRERTKMGQTATVVNGLVGEIKQLKGKIADLENELNAANQQPCLDSADMAALNDAQNVLSADQSQSASASMSGVPSQSGGGLASGQ